MTPQELRALADKLEKESKIAKKGYLKEDLYSFTSDQSYGMVFAKSWGRFWFLTKEEQNKIIKEFKNKFSLVLKKDTEFVCFIVDNEEKWFDNVNYGIEGVDQNWAKTYLTNVQEVI
jgi:hypothetical protein